MGKYVEVRGSPWGKSGEATEELFFWGGCSALSRHFETLRTAYVNGKLFFGARAQIVGCAEVFCLTRPDVVF